MSDHQQEANLASLNEIVAELVMAVSADAEFQELVRKTLRDHSWTLGYSFQGQMPPPYSLPSDGKSRAEGPADE